MGVEEKVRRLVAIAALVASGFASAVLADTTPPELVSWTVSPDIVNRLDGPIEVRVEFEFFDPSSWDLSDFKVLGLREEPQGPNSSSSSLRYGYSYTRGGDSMDGFAVFTIQPDVPRGTYYVFFEGLSDSAGNYFPTPESYPPYNGPVFDVCDSNFDWACVTTDTSAGDDSSATSSDSDENDPCSGTGFNPNCSDSSGSASDSDEDDPCSGTGYNPNCNNSSSDSTSSDSGSTSSSSSSDGSSVGAGGTACDPEVDWGCFTSGDDTGGTSGTVSSLGVTLEEPAVGLVHMGVGNLRGWAVSSAGIRKVEAFLDGEFLGEIPYGGARTDVGLAFPDIDGSDQSGFGMSFNYSGLSAGIHTIEVVAHSIDNKTASDSAQFETVRFDKEFIGAGEVINLNAAASVLTNDQIRVENISIAGEYYNLLLRWRTAEQGFEIVEIEALD
ncbi:MAG: hypothetical protein P8I86_02655 [Luminiphilus sp.]|nr:hypothetical protein [Luminiphilus sp.]MDG2037206.1 hypothetical protein [Luminiphilus sp.]